MQKMPIAISALAGCAVGVVLGAIAFTLSDSSGTVIDLLRQELQQEKELANSLRSDLSASRAEFKAEHQTLETTNSQLEKYRSAAKSNSLEQVAQVSLVESLGEQFKVIGVSDGDTITVRGPDGNVKVRLEGIDAPELGQPFGRKAKSKLSQLCSSKMCAIKVNGKDKYGRTLADVFVDGVSVNRSMIESGLAWHYYKYNNDKRLIDAEQRARDADVGVWGSDSPAKPPWDWRKLSAREKASAISGRTVAPIRPVTSSASELTHWLNSKSGVRHNSSCRWYGSTKSGRRCAADAGRACGQCGG